MKIKIETPVFSTEDENKILNSLENFFNIKFRKKGNKLVGETQNIEVLSFLKQKIDDAKIKNTILYLIDKSKVGSNSKIKLNKQTFMIGKIHFIEEDYPLGDITIEFDDVEKVVKYLT